MGEDGDRGLGAGDQIAGGLRALPGGIEAVFEAGVLVGDQFDVGGGPQEARIRLTGGPRAEAGGGLRGGDQGDSGEDGGRELSRCGRAVPRPHLVNR
ncbi:hypothetical protein ACH4FA_29785 [Streptomyces sp. NPDC017966]|uniref:hypothetical protein n=1 Tax=Streptomyces sp. NPDC017966 TaxID=3365023 RepID=UPI0037B0EC16